MEVTGGQRSSPIEWTLKHHKQFVDAAVQLGLDDFTPSTAATKTNALISELMSSAAMKGRVLLPTLKDHVENFQLLQKTTRDALGGSPPLWTVENHMRFVDAVIELGGLEKAKPAGILGLMKEERRRGLTVPIVGRHLLGLRSLQNKTRNKAIIDASSEKIDRYRKIIQRLKSSRS